MAVVAEALIEADVQEGRRGKLGKIESVDERIARPTKRKGRQKCQTSRARTRRRRWAVWGRVPLTSHEMHVSLRLELSLMLTPLRIMHPEDCLTMAPSLAAQVTHMSRFILARLDPGHIDNTATSRI
jgi:hypothetical protein